MAPKFGEKEKEFASAVSLITLLAGGERCYVEASNSNWVLTTTSGVIYFECGAQCVTVSSNVAVSSEYTLSGKNPGSKQLPMRDVDGFCYIVEGQS